MTIPSAPIPVAFCITELDRGGAERALTQLVLGLDRTEWFPRVYCLGPRGYFTDELEAGGVEVESFNALGPVSLPRVVLQLTRALRRFRPALLQSFLFHGNLVGRVAGRLAGVPRVVSGIRVAERRNRWHGRLDRWTNWLVDHNVCVSYGVADFSREVARLPASKLSVIPNGVDVERFENAAVADLTLLGLVPGHPTVLTVGRLEDQKGLRYLLQAAAIVLQDHPECQFLIVGEGPDRSELAVLSETLGIQKSVVFAGGRSDVPSLMKAATLFALPSLWEGMPNALLEAMAAGLPVVATDVEGSREIISSGLNGLLVEPRNSGALAEALLRLINEPELRTRFSRESQSTISNGFTSEFVIATYCDLYRKLIARG